ncbi:LPXTG cell wall anchor domain-containing protein [Vibrio vulnificus]|nr:LPXTG cell wall anchor domain-containing protein [Vibrio vulnificus]
MKKKLLPIFAMVLLTVGYSSVASASTGTMTKEEIAIQEQQNQDKMKKEAAIQEQQNQDMMKKKETAKQVTKGEKLPNTASNSVIMMALSAGLIALGSVFGFTRSKIKA